MAPFERDAKYAARKVFDRVTGKPIEPEHLRSYIEMIAGYPVSAEDKFLNGGLHDRRTTRRRRIKAKTIRGTGKEANRVEEDGVQLEPKKLLETRRKN